MSVGYRGRQNSIDVLQYSVRSSVVLAVVDVEHNFHFLCKRSGSEFKIPYKNKSTSLRTTSHTRVLCLSEVASCLPGVLSGYQLLVAE